MKRSTLWSQELKDQSYTIDVDIDQKITFGEIFQELYDEF